MAKALVILAEGFEEIEAVTSIDLLKRAQIDVTVVGLTSTMIKGSRAEMTISTEKTFDQVVSDYDALILPGGMPGAKNLSESERLKNLILKMNKERKLIAAICAAPAVVLAPLGLLDNKKATCFPGMEKDHFNNKIEYLNKDVVVDGNILTSKGVGTAIPFSLAIIEKLTDQETKVSVASKILYSNQN